jgi:hypothetical protein
LWILLAGFSEIVTKIGVKTDQHSCSLSCKLVFHGGYSLG